MTTKPKSPPISLTGVHWSTSLILPGPSVDAVARCARTVEIDPEDLAVARARLERPQPAFASGDVDPEDLAHTGWGLIMSVDSGQEGLDRLDALAPLWYRRRERANSVAERFRVLEYRPGESKRAFLDRYGIGVGAIEPDKLPYYLMIAGSPTEVPFEFQQQLGLEYAVGRIDFDDLENYHAYAATIVAGEVARGFHPRTQPLRTAVLGTCHTADPVGTAYLDHWVAALADELENLASEQPELCTVERYLATNALRPNVLSLFERPPSLLLAGGHGFVVERNAPEQRARQGALIAQEWSGPFTGALRRDHLLTGEDVPEDADLRDLMVFLAACYSAGTPKRSQFTWFDEHGLSSVQARPLAEYPFTARLPQRILARGALAVIGSVERAWDMSFPWPEDIRSQAFAPRSATVEVLRGLLRGTRVGHAMRPLGQLYAKLATTLHDWQTAAKTDGAETPSAEQWALHRLCTWEARNYVVIGDPAVRLASPASGQP